jgi:hypothetical protein
MIKCKLIGMEVGQSIREVANNFADLRYKKGEKYGFELIAVNSYAVEGKFIEEIITEDKQVDPFGNVIINTITKYSIFEFSITQIKTHQFLIKLFSPPRSLKSFVTAMQKTLGFGFSVYDLKIELLELLYSLQMTNQDWLVKQVKLSNIRLSSTSTSKVEINSKVNAYLDASSSLNLDGSVLEKMAYEIPTSESAEMLEISRTGVITGEASIVATVIATIASKISSK